VRKIDKIGDNIAIYNGDCLDVMKKFPDGYIDLTVTSPPYDNLRTYNGNIDQWTFEKFQGIAEQLYRVTKQGGVVVWVVGDATIKGSETGTSFRQALWFKECGFNLHDTMIYHKNNPVPNEVGKRYQPSFEYMFVFTKGKVKLFNPIMVECKMFGSVKPVRRSNQFRTKNGEMKPSHGLKYAKPNKFKHNVWDYNLNGGPTAHPAVFPLSLAFDHIVSWSNPGCVVLDPFMGSGTTGVACVNANRNFIGIELDENYYRISKERIEEALHTVCE